MIQLFYMVTRYGIVVRTLLVLAVIAVMAVTVGTADPVLAGPDGIGP